MRSKLGKAVRKRFNEQLRKRLPQFELDKLAVIPPGWKVYRWYVRPEFACFLILAFHHQQDNFTIECAWSITDTFPSNSGFQYPRAWPERQIRRDEPRDGQFRFRISYLWQPRDIWWWLVPEEIVTARMQRFTDAVISGVWDSVEAAMEEPPLEDALANVQPMVDDAVQKIVEYAMPYFEEVIQSLSKGDNSPG